MTRLAVLLWTRVRIRLYSFCLFAGHEKLANVTCTQKTGSKELDSKLASYFYENGIAFNTAASSSFALKIEESMKFARQNPLQSYKVPHRHKFSGELLDKAYESTKKLVAPILAVPKKYGATIASDGFICEKVHGAGSVSSAKAQLDWSVRTRRRLICLG